MLRVVSDQSRMESIDVMKETERSDQIKAMKKAWEMAEPGRYAKVTQMFRFACNYWHDIVTLASHHI